MDTGERPGTSGPHLYHRGGGYGYIISTLIALINSELNNINYVIGTTIFYVTK